MNILKKVLPVLCVILLTAVTAFGTYAYLTAKSDPVVNTYTAGKVSITLDEARVDLYGNPIRDTGKKDAQGNPIYEKVTLQEADRVTVNSYKLIPGHRYKKDPTIHVSEDSEECWLFVTFEGLNKDTMTLVQAGGWSFYEDHWEYGSSSVAPGESIPILTTLIYKEANTDAAADASQELVITAYAVQHEGFHSANAAWNATFGKTTTP